MNKKVYVKPDFTMVDFSLSSSVAGNCSHIVNTDGNSCGFMDENNGYVVFGLGCDITYDDYVSMDLCYHIPTDAATVFSS